MAQPSHNLSETSNDSPHDLPLADCPKAESSACRTGSKLSGGLYLVATPIGNMGDITYRAVEALRMADLVACEDSRVTGKLMTRLGLDRPLFPYHDHNAEKARPHLINKLKAGESIALVSDAGTPLVSDPGYRLVRACVEEGIPVTALPGASALLTALQLSALPNDRFLFAGFLPNKPHGRRQILRELATVPASLIFYESPNRLADCLADMAVVLGDRPAAMCRELTKLHEEVIRGSLLELDNLFAKHSVKGEVVIVVGPPGAQAALSDEDIADKLQAILREGASVKDAAAQLSAETGLPRRDLYATALKLARHLTDDDDSL